MFNNEQRIILAIRNFKTCPTKALDLQMTALREVAMSALRLAAGFILAGIGDDAINPVARC